jgi:hypothetical protein
MGKSELIKGASQSLTKVVVWIQVSERRSSSDGRRRRKTGSADDRQVWGAGRGRGLSLPCTTSVRGKRVVLVSSKATFDRNLAAPHKDRWNLSLDYGIAPEHGVAPEHFTLLAEFDGSAIVERTAVEALARSYDDEANDQRAHPRPRGRGRRFVKGCWGEA